MPVNQRSEYTKSNNFFKVYGVITCSTASNAHISINTLLLLQMIHAVVATQTPSLYTHELLLLKIWLTATTDTTTGSIITAHKPYGHKQTHNKKWRVYNTGTTPCYVCVSKHRCKNIDWQDMTSDSEWLISVKFNVLCWDWWATALIII